MTKKYIVLVYKRFNVGLYINEQCYLYIFRKIFKNYHIQCNTIYEFYRFLPKKAAFFSKFTLKK